MNCSKVRNRVFMLALIMSLIAGCQSPIERDQDKLICTDGIRLLLDVMKIAREANPDYTLWADKLQQLYGPERQQLLDSLSANNRANLALNQKIDSLLSSNAYRLYYRQFNNVTPKDHRQLLLWLPYGWMPGPADISQTLYSVCDNYDSIAVWFGSIIEEINLDTVQQIALSWLPEGEYDIPPIHFIIDGNGDAFAREGEVVFDIYSLVLRRRPMLGRYSNLSEISVSQIETVLGHEFHHVYARPFFRSTIFDNDDIASRWRHLLIKRMASEGIAMQCNPPEGLYRAIKEDTAIVAYWFRVLDSVLSVLKKDQVPEDQIRKWYSDTYQDTARRLLTDYLSRSFGGEELKRQVYLHSDAHPTLIYTLGWWMVSHISKNGKDRQAVLDLLKNPQDLFAMYNDIVAKGPDSLRAPI